MINPFQYFLSFYNAFAGPWIVKHNNTFRGDAPHPVIEGPHIAVTPDKQIWGTGPNSKDAFEGGHAAMKAAGIPKRAHALTTIPASPELIKKLTEHPMHLVRHQMKNNIAHFHRLVKPRK